MRTASAARSRTLSLVTALALIASLVSPSAVQAEPSNGSAQTVSPSVDLLVGNAPLATVTPNDPDAGCPATFDALAATGAIQGSLGAEKLQLGFNLKLDDAALQENFLTWIEKQGPDSDIKDLDQALDADDDLAPISFSFAYALSDTVEKPAYPVTKDIVVSDESTEIIGHYTYEMVPGSTDLLKVEGVFFKHMYNRTGITIRDYFELDLESGHTGAPELTLSPGNGSVDATVEFSGDEPDDGVFTIAKTVVGRQDGDPNISYKIVAKTDPTSTKADLAGQIISDTLPAGLEFVGAQDASGTALTEGDASGQYRYDEATRTFTYLVPADQANPTEKVTAATITIRTQVSQEAYIDHVSGTSSKATSFSNTASVTKPGTTDPLATSSTVKASFGGTGDAAKPLVKIGRRLGINGSEYTWFLRASAYMSGGRVWVVDRIKGIDTAHDYTKQDGSIAFTVESASRSASIVEPPDPVRFDDLSSEALDALTESGTKAVSYSYDTNGDGTPDEAVLIIPLLDPGDRNKSVTLTYNTTVVADPAAVDPDTLLTLKNDVEMAWSEASYGNGPGTLEGSTPTLSVKKDVTDEYSLLAKTVGIYDEPNHEIPWGIKLNLAGADLGNATQTITDTFDTDKLQLKSLVYRIDGGEDWTEVAEAATNPTASPHYELKEDLASGTTAIVIEVDAVGASLVEFRLVTTVIDPAILGSQLTGERPSDPKVANRVEAELIANGTQRNVTAEASKALPNILLQKRAMKLDGTTAGTEYDYTNHLVTWQVTVNPNHAALSPAEENGTPTALVALTDLLPIGTTFHEVKSVKRTSADGTGIPMSIASTPPGDEPTTEAAITSETDGFLVKLTTAAAVNGDGYSNDTATFTFAPLGGGVAVADQGAFTDSFVITFTTTIDKDYRTATFTDTDKAYKVDNIAELSGTVIGVAAGAAGEVPHKKVDVAAGATQTVRAEPITKKGTFHTPSEAGNPYESTLGPVAYADWAITFNKHACDMEATQVVDELPACYELDLASLSFAKAVVGSDGSATAGEELSPDELASLNVNASYSGFSFTVPAAFKEQPILITFKTLVVDSVSAQGLTNTVNLYRGDVLQTDSTFKPDNAADFNAASYASALRTPWIHAIKTSANTARDSSGTPRHAIGGATFELSANSTWSDDARAWTATPDAPSKSATSKAGSGSAPFWFLSYNVLYTLSEKAAPEGYANDAPSRTIVFVRNASLGADPDFMGGLPDGTLVIAADGSETTVGPPDTTIEHAVNADGGALKGVVVPMADTPTGELAFVKTTDRGGAVKGMSFTLENAGGTVEALHAESDEDGLVKFENVDPGTYTLAENPTEGQRAMFTEAPDFTVEIKADGTCTIESPEADSVVHDGKGYRIVNTYNVGTLALQKVDAGEAGTVLSGAEFALSPEGSDKLAAYLVEDQAQAGAYVLAMSGVLADRGPLDTDENGAPYLAPDESGELKLVAGTYTLAETAVPEGYDGFISPEQRSVTVETGKTPIAITVANEKIVPVTHTVSKAWDEGGDAGGADVLHPPIEVQLLADGEPCRTPETLDEASGWEHRWTDLPSRSSAGPIVYTVVETAVPLGYEATYEARDDQTRITNTRVPTPVAPDAPEGEEGPNGSPSNPPSPESNRTPPGGEASESATLLPTGDGVFGAVPAIAAGAAACALVAAVLQLRGRRRPNGGDDRT